MFVDAKYNYLIRVWKGNATFYLVVLPIEVNFTSIPIWSLAAEAPVKADDTPGPDCCVKNHIVLLFPSSGTMHSNQIKQFDHLFVYENYKLIFEMRSA